MDSELEFLFAGFAVFWAGLFVYIVLLQMRLRSLEQDIETLEERLAESDDGAQGGDPDRPPAEPATTTTTTTTSTTTSTSS